jgi:DNA-binding NarL/FixJ family response regulator
MTSIFLVDDHPLAVSGIGSWLNNTGRFAVTGSAGSIAEAKAALENLGLLPDIIILDISLGKEDGIGLIPVLKEICEKKGITLPGIVVCTMHEDPFLIKRVMSAGADAYISKSAAMDEIITAIDAVLSGNTYVNPKYNKIINKDIVLKLTSRENEILSHVKRRMTNQQIAEQMGISVRTVENHLVRIYDKTKTKSRAELIEL